MGSDVVPAIMYIKEAKQEWKIMILTKQEGFDTWTLFAVNVQLGVAWEIIVSYAQFERAKYDSLLD